MVAWSLVGWSMVDRSKCGKPAVVTANRSKAERLRLGLRARAVPGWTGVDCGVDSRSRGRANLDETQAREKAMLAAGFNPLVTSNGMGDHDDWIFDSQEHINTPSSS
eukprot:gene30773-35812_t